MPGHAWTDGEDVGRLGSMDIADTAHKYMGDAVFKASDLLEVAKPEDFPESLQYAIQGRRNASPVKALGRLLAESTRVSKVGQHQKTNLWKVQS
jgi:hypothetical protein